MKKNFITEFKKIITLSIIITIFTAINKIITNNDYSRDFFSWVLLCLIVIVIGCIIDIFLAVLAKAISYLKLK